MYLSICIHYLAISLSNSFLTLEISLPLCSAFLLSAIINMSLESTDVCRAVCVA